MKSFLILFTLLLLPISNFAQTQTTLQDLGRLGANPTVMPYIFNGSATNGNYLYNAGDGKVFIYKLTDPKKPTYIKTLSSPTGVQRLWAGENYLFVYTGTTIKIYALTDPENPSFKADYLAGVDLHKVSAKGNYMFVLYLSEYNTGKWGSFEIVDISNPANPQLKGTYKPSNYEGRSFSFSETANRVYVAHYDLTSHQGYIREIDYSNPVNLIQVRELIIPNGPKEISVVNNTLFVLKDGGWQGPSTLEAYDLSVSPITKLGSRQVSAGQAWDMHAYGNSITVSLLEANGLKNYTWNSSTKVFENEITLNILWASQLSWYTVSTQGGGSQNLKKTSSGFWIYFYYYIVEKYVNSLESETKGYYQRLVEEKIWVEIPDAKVKLTMAISPTLAATEGCTVSPGVGGHDYNKATNENLTATENASMGWNFTQWTGDVSSTSKTVSVKMDKDKTATANFVKPTLTLFVTGKDKFHCPTDTQKKDTVMNISLCASIEDDWKVSSIEIKADGTGDDKKEIKSVHLYKVGFGKIGETTFNADNGTATFPVDIIISKAQCVYFILEYEFVNEIDVKDSSKTYIPQLKASWVTANPLAYANYMKLPGTTFSGSTILYGTIVNIRTLEGFSKIQKAVDSNKTQDGDVIAVCPCELKENVEVTKSLTIKSVKGKEVTKVSADKSNDHIFEIKSDEVTIEGFTLSGSTGSVTAAVFANFAAPSSNKIKKLNVTSSSIQRNYWGVFVQGPEAQTTDTAVVEIDDCDISNNANDGITTTGWKTSLTIKNSVVNTNKNGINCGDIVDITNSKIKFNSECGVLADGSVYVLSENNFITEFSSNDHSGICAWKYAKYVTLKCDDNSKILIQSNGWYGVNAPLASIRGNNLDVRYNGCFDASQGTGIYGNDVDLMNVQVNQNKGNGIYSFRGLGVQADEGNISEVSGNDKYGIEVGGGATSATVRGFENSKVQIYDNGEYGIWTRNADFYGVNLEVMGNGRLNPQNGTGITAFLVELENAKIKYNKGDGVYSAGNIYLDSYNGYISEVSFNNGSGLYSHLSYNVNLRGRNGGKVIVDNNGEYGVYANVASFYGLDIDISKNGRLNKDFGNGILAGTIELTNTNVISNSSDGIKGGRIIFNSGSVKLNKGWGISLYDKASFSKINPGVSIINNTNGGILFKQSSNKTLKNNLEKNVSSNSIVLHSCNIIDNQGEGIRNEGSDSFTILNTNISGNRTMGINNINNASIMTAQNNWWGNSSGPAGAGTGSGDKVSLNVSYSNWLTNPTSVVISSPIDTLKTFRNRLDTLKVSFYNYQRVPDKINITVIDSLGWLVSSRNFSVDIIDSNLVQIPFIFSIPSNVNAGTLNRIKINAVSNANNIQQYQRSIYQWIYTPVASRVLISPLNTVLAQNREVTFTSKCYDQYAYEISILPEWTATKGIINNNGKYTAPSDTGKFTITARSGTAQASAIVHVVAAQRFLQKIQILPDSVFINPNQSTQFYASCRDQFDSLFVIITTWSSTGGTINQNGYFTAGTNTGIYKVTAQTGNIKGEAKVNISLVSDVKEKYLPAQFGISQNYPNPFNPSTKINYSIPKISRVKIIIYNILGQIVEVLVNEEKLPGNYMLNWNAGKYASGIYICRISANSNDKNFVNSIKMIILK